MKRVCILESETHFQALAAKQLLEDNGIYAVMPSEHLPGVLPQYKIGNAAYQLFVNSEDAEKAGELINAFIESSS